MRKIKALSFLAAVIVTVTLAAFAVAQAVTVSPKNIVKPAVKAAPAKPAVKPKPAVKGAKVVAPVVKKAVAKTVSPVEAKKITNDFIIGYLLTDGTKFTLGTPKDFNSGLYEIEVKIDGSTEAIKSYLAKDGLFFFPSGMDIAKVKAESAKAKVAAPAAPAQPVAVAVKFDKPVVELFVMSYCPYGTQIEKGIIPVARALGDKIDFSIKFVNYAMHGDKEIKENMFQYCVGKEQKDKMLAYVDCFVKSASGDQSACAIKAGVDASKTSACVAATDKEFKIMETFAKGESSWQSQFPPFAIYDADNKKYGVGGSPTLVINGVETSSGRDSASLLATICAAFNAKPAECSVALPSDSPAPGFGTGTTNAPAASCGS